MNPRYYTVIVLALLLSACAELGIPERGAPILSRPATNGGIYEGSISLPNGESTTVAVVALDSGETRIVAANGMQMSVNFSGPANRLRGEGLLFASNTSTKPADRVLADGSGVAPVSIDAVIAPGISIQGSYSSRGGTGRFNGRYLKLYERDANLAKLAGTYRSYKQGSSFVGSIDRAGRLSGNDERGIYDGQLSVISPNINVYRAQVTYRPSGQAPFTVTGLATLNDLEKNGDEDLLQMQLSNQERHFFSQIRRVR